MQNLPALAPVIGESSSFAPSAGAGRVGLTDARDAAAEVAAAPAQHVARTYCLTGPVLVFYADVAAVLSQLLG